MKKFYTMLAAMVCASSMIATAADFAPKAPRSINEPVRLSQANFEKPAVAMKQVDGKKAGSISTIQDLEGKWDMCYYYYSSSYSSFVAYNSPMTITVVDDTHVTISNFWDDGTNDITADVDVAAGTVTIPVTEVLETSSYGNLGVCQMTTSGSAQTTTPLVLSFYGEYLYTDSYWAVYLMDGDSAGECWDYCAYFIGTPCNASMTFTYSYSGTSYTQTYNVDTYLKNNVLGVANMVGYGFDDYVEWDIDPETKTAVAQNQAIYASDDYTIYLYSYDGRNYDDQVVATIGGANNNEITFTDWTLYIDESTTYGQIGDCVIETPFNLLDSNSVKVNFADDDATVEYYNLQGMKIAQPTEKGIYIRKAGKEVSKIAL